jgi:hypothetical protein
MKKVSIKFPFHPKNEERDKEKRSVKPTYSYKNHPSSYWRNKLLEMKTLTCSGNKAGRTRHEPAPRTTP